MSDRIPPRGHRVDHPRENSATGHGLISGFVVASCADYADPIQDRAHFDRFSYPEALLEASRFHHELHHRIVVIDTVHECGCRLSGWLLERGTGKAR